MNTICSVANKKTIQYLSNIAIRTNKEHKLFFLLVNEIYYKILPTATQIIEIIRINY